MLALVEIIQKDHTFITEGSHMNGADKLCQTLLGNDVDVCFANPGTSEMHFVAALDTRPEMRCILGLFEGVVTGAADGYARMAEKPAATLLHLGPGLANGLANLHNAKRAGTPMVNVVGDHATEHLSLDAPLTSDIVSLATPMSHWVHAIPDAGQVGSDTAKAIGIARTSPGQIATLILPADAAWSNVPEADRNRVYKAKTPWIEPADIEAIKSAAKIIRSKKRTLIMLGGSAMRTGALATAGRISNHCNVDLLAARATARTERGAGRVTLNRLPYVVDHAVDLLAPYEHIILIGTGAPVAFFLYPDKPGELWAPGATVSELAGPHLDLALTLDMLADELGVGAAVDPNVAKLRPVATPDAGAITPANLAAAVVSTMPENAILCDESITFGHVVASLTKHAPPHDLLQLTGGSIGIGIPLALGAAIACPDRKVIALQADGSGMYTVQGLWSQVRENCNIVTVILANRRYQILHGELANVGGGPPGVNANRMFNLDNPEINWTALAKSLGMPAIRVDCAAELAKELKKAIAHEGPYLIEAMI